MRCMYKSIWLLFFYSDQFYTLLNIYASEWWHNSNTSNTIAFSLCTYIRISRWRIGHQCIHHFIKPIYTIPILSIGYREKKESEWTSSMKLARMLWSKEKRDESIFNSRSVHTYLYKSKQVDLSFDLVYIRYVIHW